MTSKDPKQTNTSGTRPTRLTIQIARKFRASASGRPAVIALTVIALGYFASKLAVAYFPPPGAEPFEPEVSQGR